MIGTIYCVTVILLAWCEPWNCVLLWHIPCCIHYVTRCNFACVTCLLPHANPRSHIIDPVCFLSGSHKASLNQARVVIISHWAAADDLHMLNAQIVSYCSLTNDNYIYQVIFLDLVSAQNLYFFHLGLYFSSLLFLFANTSQSTDHIRCWNGVKWHIKPSH